MGNVPLTFSFPGKIVPLTPPTPSQPKTAEVFLESPTPLPEQCVQEKRSSVRITACPADSLLCLKSIHTLKPGIPAPNSSSQTRRTHHTKGGEMLLFSSVFPPFHPLAAQSLLKSLAAQSPKAKHPGVCVTNWPAFERWEADHVSAVAATYVQISCSSPSFSLCPFFSVSRSPLLW